MPFLAMFSTYKNIIILVAILCVLAGVSITSYGHGKKIQRADDQVLIDGIRADIQRNKEKAQAELANALNEVIAIQVERDKFKTKLQKEYGKNVETTNKLAAAYAAYGLRFRPDINAWGGGKDAMPEKGSASGNNESSYCIVSREVDAALKLITYDCDMLNNNYKLLYDWANAK